MLTKITLANKIMSTAGIATTCAILRAEEEALLLLPFSLALEYLTAAMFQKPARSNRNHFEQSDFHLPSVFGSLFLAHSTSGKQREELLGIAIKFCSFACVELSRLDFIEVNCWAPNQDEIVYFPLVPPRRTLGAPQARPSFNYPTKTTPSKQPATNWTFTGSLSLFLLL